MAMTPQQLQEHREKLLEEIVETEYMPIGFSVPGDMIEPYGRWLLVERRPDSRPNYWFSTHETAEAATRSVIDAVPVSRIDRLIDLDTGERFRMHLSWEEVSY